MSLYQDAVTVLCGQKAQGSLKSRVYNNTSLRSKPAQLFALIAEAAKHDTFLKEIVEHSGLLKDEPKLTPLISLLLLQDHFFSKGGIAAPTKHPLRQAVDRHKARLQSEFTRARLKRKCGSVDALKACLAQEKATLIQIRPRWIRVNSLKSNNVRTCLEQIPSSTRADSRSQVSVSDDRRLVYHEDSNIPFLAAINESFEIVKTQAYKSGAIILQDKASCFPAYLLLGEADTEPVGNVIDACAAPGNKTTHVAAIMHERALERTIFACERDTLRSATLQMMISRAAARNVVALAKQDFLALDPRDDRFANVTHLLLDPSCSGSGILGREDVPELDLPAEPSNAGKVQTGSARTSSVTQTKGKKRMRSEVSEDDDSNSETGADIESASHEESRSVIANTQRLQKLAGLQSRIIEHAMSFPAAKKITYSTCSIHTEENEEVVATVLASLIAQQRTWTVLRRQDQPKGLQSWPHRGVAPQKPNDARLTNQQLEACIRCYPDDKEDTMGFFVCGFVRSDCSLPCTANDNERWEGFD